MDKKPYIFDGRNFAQKKFERLKIEIDELRASGVGLKLASIIVGENPASRLYVGLKKKRGEEIGIDVQVISLSSSLSKEYLVTQIKKLNRDQNINGIMIQLPLPEKFSEEDKIETINAIDTGKDVDGLREDSPYLHPTSKAVIEVLAHAINIVRPPCKDGLCKVCVVGSTGMVGKPLVKKLQANKKLRINDIDKDGSNYFGMYSFQVFEADHKTNNLGKLTKGSDIVISATGNAGLITKNMVKSGAILIDVGSPVGDIQKKAYDKASFVSPVPGGIGPVTIACLLENLISGGVNSLK